VEDLVLRSDPQLIYEAQRITAAANVHTIHKALKWYEHWCELGNEAAAEVAAQTLRTEIAKAHEAARPLAREKKIT